MTPTSLENDDLGAIGGRELIAYQSAGGELQDATTDAQAVLDALIQDASLPLLEAQSLVGSALDEIVGTTDQQLLGANQDLQKFISAFIKVTYKVLDGAKNQALSAGAVVPYSTLDMGPLVEGDPLTLAGTAFPVLGSMLGMTPAEPDPVWKVPSDGDTPGDPPTWYAPTEPAPFIVTNGYPVATPGSVPMPTVGPTPYPTAPGTTVTTTAPHQGGPINVTVVVPPIAVNQAAACPAPNVTVTCPPAGTPFQGTPPRALIADGVVKYSIPTNQWVYTSAPAAPGGPDVVPLAAPVPPTSSPPTSPPPPTGHSILVAPLPVAGTGESSTEAVNWGAMDACEDAHTAASGIQLPTVPTGPTEQAGLAGTLADAMFGDGAAGLAKKQFGGAWGSWSLQVDEWAKTAQGLGETVDVFFGKVGRGVAGALLPGGGKQNPAAAAYYGARLGLAGTAELATHVPFTYLYQSDMYMLQYSNPQFLPTQIRVDSAYLANTIDDGTWTCWTRALGNHPEPARRVMLGDQTRPGLMDIISLHRRGHITEKDLYTRLREMGVLDTNYVREYLAVTKVLPTQSDLIRFMVRDSADDKVAERYRYDDGFTDKYTGQMKEWAKALGLDDTYFRYSWRAHWDIPSYTQLVEMIARLRPDRLEVKEWADTFGRLTEPGDIKAAPKKPPVVERADVVQALQVNDMAPGWIDPLIAVSYTPINRTDAVRAYMMGAFTDEQLYDSFLNTRYSERDARLMLDFYRKDKARRLRNVSGSWSARKVMRYYKGGLLTEQEAKALLADVLPNLHLVNVTIHEAQLEMQADQRAQMIKATKRGFILGEYTADQVRRQLEKWGVEAAAVKRLIDLWTVERDGRLKQPTVAMLGKWVAKSIITVEECQRRLRNLGYGAADSDRIIAAALKWQYEEGPPTEEELGLDVQAEITSQKMAKKSTPENLDARLRTVLAEARRIHQELTRRALNAGTPEPEPVAIP